MAENYLVVDGNKIDLTPEQVDALIKTNSSFKRQFKRLYYMINCLGDVEEELDSRDEFDDMAYVCANYCTDETKMRHRAELETLSRQLWRASELDSSVSEDRAAYTIIADYCNKTFDVDYTYDLVDVTSAVFNSRQSAETALKEIALPWLRKNPWFFEDGD